MTKPITDFTVGMFGIVLVALIATIIALSPQTPLRPATPLEKEFNLLEQRVNALDGGEHKYWVCGSDRVVACFRDNGECKDRLSFFMTIEKVETIGKVSPISLSSKKGYSNQYCEPISREIYNAQ